MANYLVIGVGSQNGHAEIVSATGNDNLFWVIDEHFNPYECVFTKITGSFSFYFPVDTLLEMETDPTNDSFCEINSIDISPRQVSESGGEIGMLLIEWAEELWKQVKIDQRRLPEGLKAASRWKSFLTGASVDGETILTYYKNAKLIDVIRASGKELAAKSYRANASA